MLKTIEDALEGVLYLNDRQVKSGDTYIHEPDKDEPSLQITIQTHDY